MRVYLTLEADSRDSSSASKRCAREDSDGAYATRTARDNDEAARGLAKLCCCYSYMSARLASCAIHSIGRALVREARNAAAAPVRHCAL